MGGVGVVINPKSRGNRRALRRVEKLAAIVGDDGLCVATKSADDVPRVANEMRERGINLLALCGGDGTNHLTLTAFRNVWGDTPLPPIALLRGGTMNTVAEGCGIRGSPESILRALLTNMRDQKPLYAQRRTLLEIDGQLGFIFGNGLIHNFLREYYRAPDPSPISAGALLGKAVWSVLTGGEVSQRLTAPFTARVTVGGVTWPQETFIAVLAATEPQIGLGFTPFWRCDEQPGTFHLVGITAPSLINVTFELPRIWLGKPLTAPNFTDAVVSEAIFESDAPLSYTVDGDLYTGGVKLTLRAGPTVTIVHPTPLPARINGAFEHLVPLHRTTT